MDDRQACMMERVIRDCIMCIRLRLRTIVPKTTSRLTRGSCTCKLRNDVDVCHTVSLCVNRVGLFAKPRKEHYTDLGAHQYDLLISLVVTKPVWLIDYPASHQRSTA
jgi:hypothetical protein